MPFYDYKCDHCDHKIIDVNRKITENVSILKCPKCKKYMKQTIKNTNFNLKGTGWYKSGMSK